MFEDKKILVTHERAPQGMTSLAMGAAASCTFLFGYAANVIERIEQHQEVCEQPSSAANSNDCNTYIGTGIEVALIGLSMAFGVFASRVSANLMGPRKTMIEIIPIENEAQPSIKP